MSLPTLLSWCNLGRIVLAGRQISQTRYYNAAASNVLTCIWTVLHVEASGRGELDYLGLLTRQATFISICDYSLCFKGFFMGSGGLIIHYHIHCFLMRPGIGFLFSHLLYKGFELNTLLSSQKQKLQS